MLLQIRQELSHLPLQVRTENVVLSKPSLPLGTLFGQNMTVKRLITANFTFCCFPKSFRCCPVALHLRHESNPSSLIFRATTKHRRNQRRLPIYTSVLEVASKKYLSLFQFILGIA